MTNLKSVIQPMMVRPFTHTGLLNKAIANDLLTAVFRSWNDRKLPVVGSLR